MAMKLWMVALSAGLEALACDAPEERGEAVQAAVTGDGTPVVRASEPLVRVEAPARVEAPVGPGTPVVPVVPGPAPLPGPLSHAHAAALAEVREERIYGSPIDHFTVSNEYRHDLWFSDVRGLGGAYVGVASDQNYTLIAAARSEVAYLIDLDRQVVDLHAIYAALIAAAPDPNAFMALFDAKASARRAAREAILAGLAGRAPADQKRAMAFFEAQREVLADYLRKVQTAQQGSWLADPDAYAYVRAMFAAGRIRVLQGNLLGKSAMPSIAASARALALPIKVLYLSNAEEYLFYGDAFAANVRALPAADGSVVLRTIHDRFEGWESCGDGDNRWNYQVQGLADFQRRLGDRGRGRNQNRTAMLAAAQQEGAIQRRARGVSAIVSVPVARQGEEISLARAPGSFPN